MRAGLIDGAILLHSFAPEVVADLASRLPVVSMVHRFAGLPVDCVDTDEPGAIVQLFSMLRRAGHERIGFVMLNGDKSWEKARFAGYREAHYQHDQDFDRDLVLQLGPGVEAGVAIAERIRARLDDGVTAWICACDPIAYQLNGQLRQLGVEPGKDVVMAGFDGLPPPRGEAQIPTIRVPYRDLGGAAVRRLAHRIESPTSRIRDILLRHDFVPGNLSVQPQGVSAAIPPVTATNAKDREPQASRS